MSITFTKDLVLEIIESEQIAFQFYDALIMFTQLEDDNVDKLDDEIINMTNIVKSARSFNIVEHSTDITNDFRSGFIELIEWSQSTDILIAIDGLLMLCIPHKVIAKYLSSPKI